MPGYPSGVAINYCPGQSRKKSADRHWEKTFAELGAGKPFEDTLLE